MYIDDCCKLKAKIGSVLGDGVSVKLDLFHAVQRILNTMHKRHPLVQQCMQDLQLVFRQDGDSRVDVSQTFYLVEGQTGMNASITIINSLFNRSKMGILLAYALLTIVMYSHNSSRKVHGRVVSQPITASLFCALSTSHSKPIGIMPKTREEQQVSQSDY